MRTQEWRPSAPTRSVPVAEEESEKWAVIEDFASLWVKEVRVLDHCTSSPSKRSALSLSRETRIRLQGGIFHFASPLLKSKNKKLPFSPFLLASASTYASGNLSKMCCGSKESKASRAHWIVRPHPRPRAETDTSLSKIEKGTSCRLSAWPSTSPVMPAPMIRTLDQASAGLGGDIPFD